MSDSQQTEMFTLCDCDELDTDACQEEDNQDWIKIPQKADAMTWHRYTDPSNNTTWLICTSRPELYAPWHMSHSQEFKCSTICSATRPACSELAKVSAIRPESKKKTVAQEIKLSDINKAGRETRSLVMWKYCCDMMSKNMECYTASSCVSDAANSLIREIAIV